MADALYQNRLPAPNVDRGSSRSQKSKKKEERSKKLKFSSEADDDHDLMVVPQPPPSSKGQEIASRYVSNLSESLSLSQHVLTAFFFVGKGGRSAAKSDVWNMVQGVTPGGKMVVDIVPWFLTMSLAEPNDNRGTLWFQSQ